MSKGSSLGVVALAAAFFVFPAVSAVAQSSVWSVYTGARENIDTARAVSRATFPEEYSLFNLNRDPLRRNLFSVVDSGTQPRSTVITLPNADGRLEQFEIFEASNFEPELQARFPQIRAFSGRGITDRFATLKLSYSPESIDATIFRTARGSFRTGGETEIIERYADDGSVYAVFRSQRNRGQLPWSCTTEEKSMFSDWSSMIKEMPAPDSSEGTIRTMRLVQSNNGEYANYHGASTSGTPADLNEVMMAFNATLTRTNGVYERDLGLHLNLVPETTRVIYFDPATDPYSTTLSQWNNQLRDAVRANFNTNEYDIGHMFGASGGGGNAGCIGCVCTTNTASTHFGHDKARGITSPADGVPQGDFFDIDYVAHEVGHQLGANHTFSFGQLPVPENLGQDKEIGSGITIMGYAGIGTGSNIAVHSIDVFHATSIQQVQMNLPTRPCPAPIPMTVNNKPVITAVPDYTIPIMTPFKLTGSATDPEGDPITYNWEQNDSAQNTGATGPAASSANPAKEIGPNWVTFPSSPSGTKLFPRLSTILAGQFTTAGESPDPADSGMLMEALSSVTRTLNFRLTVRDNRPYVAGSTIGQTNFEDTTVTVTNTAGPFKVTQPDSLAPPTWQAGTQQTITWLVNGTNLGLVNTPNVKITLSTDGGQTFPIVLAASTPNDGSELVTLPVSSTTNAARIQVEAIDNIFFDISDANFTISAPATAAAADIAGRISDAGGNGIRGVRVTLMSADGGPSRVAITNAFGYYRFEDVATGANYVVTPGHKRYTFDPINRVVAHNDEAATLDFNGQ